MRLSEAAALEMMDDAASREATASSFWSGILDDIWKDPATRRAILDRVDRLFWLYVWPSIRERRWKCFRVSWLRGVFELVFGTAPASEADTTAP